MSIKKRPTLRALDPYLQREKEQYGHALPSREYMLQILVEQGVPVNERALQALLEITEEEEEMIRTLLLMVALAACSGGGKLAETTTNETSNDNGTQTSTATGSAAVELTGVGVAFNFTPADATVTIDDVVMGRANQLDPVVALAPGIHTLVVEQPGHKSYRAEFSVTDKVEKFTVVLEATK